MQVEMVSKVYAEVEPNSASCNRCKPKKVARKVANWVCYTPHSTWNLSHEAVAAQGALKLQGKLHWVTLVISICDLSTPENAE